MAEQKRKNPAASKDLKAQLRQKRLLAAKLKLRKLLLARRNINAFQEYCFVDAKTQEPQEQQWFHRAWHAHFDAHPKAGVIGPRDHGKTTQVIGRVLFKLGQNPNLRIKIVSADKETAKKRVQASRTHIDTNERLHEVFPELVSSPVIDEWSNYAIMVKRTMISPDPSLEARGILTSGVGGRADILVGDDVVDFTNAIRNPALRKTVKDAWHNVWMNLLEPDGLVWYICTPWTKSDLSHELMHNPDWKFLSTVINGNYDPIWPSKWSKQALLQRMREIGRRHFDRAFRGLPVSDDDRIFEEEWTASAKVAGAKVHRLRIPKEWPRYTGVDLAIGQRNSSKFTVIFTLAVDPATQTRYVVDIRRGQMSSVKQAEMVLEVNKHHQPELIVVENNAYQQALVDWVQKLGGPDIPVIGLATGGEKASLDLGIPGMAVEFQNNLWVIPQDDKVHRQGCPCTICIFVSELEDYPFGENTDIVMAAWMAVKGIRYRRSDPGLISEGEELASAPAEDPSVYVFGDERGDGGPDGGGW